MQTRRAVQDFLLLLNRPDRWAEVHGIAGAHALCEKGCWAAVYQGKKACAGECILAAVGGPQPSGEKATTRKGIRLWSAYYRELIHLRPVLPRVNLSPAVLADAQDRLEKDGNLKAALEAALGATLVSPRSARPAAQGRKKAREERNSIIERLAWEGERLPRRQAPLRTLLRAQLVEVHTTTLQSSALGRVAEVEEFDFATALSIVTNPAYILALPTLPVSVLPRLIICSVPGCGRAFVRALSKPAQKHCQRCRRRWTPQQRWYAAGGRQYRPRPSTTPRSRR